MYRPFTCTDIVLTDLLKCVKYRPTFTTCLWKTDWSDSEIPIENESVNL